MHPTTSPLTANQVLGALEGLARRANDNPDALLQIAQTLHFQGYEDRAREVVRQALSIAGDEPEVVTRAAEIASIGIPRWHFKIVRDEIRNSAYDAALRKVIRPGMRVLDIGSGTGLLAMMAARAGAARVFTCEMNGAIAEACKKVIAKNGYSDQIRVIHKHSLDLDVASDLGGPVDLLVSEIISNDMLCEGALPAHEHAVAHLLKPGAQVIPARGTVRVALAEDLRRERRRMGTAAGFDLTPFNFLAPARYRVAADAQRIALHSAPADLASFDFQSGGPYRAAQGSIQVRAEHAGANGILQWIRIDLDDSIRYENSPLSSTSSCWSPVFCPFTEAFRPERDSVVSIHYAHDSCGLRIWATAS